MKKFKFAHEDKQWDRFSSFHAFNRNFVEFETGELMVIGAPDPHNRRFYDKYNVQLVTTTDKDCPQLYFDKECTDKVKRAWVSHKGQQHLAIDYEQCVATTYDIGYTNIRSKVLGEHVRQASVYWAGADRQPYVLCPIKVQTPNPTFKKKVHGVLKEVQIAVSALWRMKTKDGRKDWWYDNKHMANEKWYDSSVEDIVGEIIADDDAFRSVANNGFEYPRVTQEVDLLYVKPRKEK